MSSVLQGAAAFLAVAGASFQVAAWGLRWRIGSGGDPAPLIIVVAAVVVVLALRYRGALTAAGCGLCWTLAAMLAAGGDWLWAGAAPTSAILVANVVLPLALVGAGLASFGGSGRGGAVAGGLLGLAASSIALGQITMTSGSAHQAALVCWLGGALLCHGWRRPIAGFEVDWHGAGPSAAAALVAALVLLQRDLLAAPVWTGAFDVLLGVLAGGAVFGVLLRVPPAWAAALAAGTLLLTLDRHDPNSEVWVAVGTWSPLLLAGAALAGVARSAAPLAVPMTGAVLLVAMLDAVADTTPGATGWWDPTPALALIALFLLARRSFAPLAIALVVAPLLTFGAAGGVRPWEQDEVAVADEIAGVRTVARTRDRGVFWDPNRQTMEVRVRGEAWGRWGPGIADSVLLGTVPIMCRATDEQVILVGADEGAVAHALSHWSLNVRREPLGPSLAGLGPHQLGLDGPGPVSGDGESDRVQPRPSLWSRLWPSLWGRAGVRDGIRSRAAEGRGRPAGVLTFAAPIPASRPDLLTEEFHRLTRTAVGPEGIVAFAVRLDQHPPSSLEGILGAAHRGHGRIRTFLRAGTLLVVGGASTEVGPGGWARIPDAAKAALHAIGVTTAEDFRGLQIDLPSAQFASLRDQDLPVASWHREVRTTPAADPEAGLEWLASQTAVAAQRQRLRYLAGSGPRPTQRATDPRSNLAWQESLEQQATRARRLALREGAAAVPFARALADRAHGVAELILLESMVGPRAKARPAPEAWGIAAALDPSVVDPAPWQDILYPAPAGLGVTSPLTDYARWPAAEALVEQATGEGPLAHCLRARLRDRCVRAWVERMESQALTSAESVAFRHVLDPWGLDRAWQNVTAARGLDAASQEILPLVRADLPWPEGVDAVLQGAVAGRIRLAEALAGRTDPRSLTLLAALLEDGDREVCMAAGASLFRWVGQAIPYDPEWSATRRREAAEAVRHRVQETANDDDE